MERVNDRLDYTGRNEVNEIQRTSISRWTAIMSEVEEATIVLYSVLSYLRTQSMRPENYSVQNMKSCL